VGNALQEQEWVEAETAVVAVALDGVMVPDNDGQRAAKATREAAKDQGLSRAPSGPAGYREVGCGTVTLYDEEGHRLDTVRYGRAPESKKKTLTAPLDAELSSILAVRPDLIVVAIADGAEENWRYFDRPFSDSATRIVDHGHACEHLREAMSACYGDKSVEGRAQYARFRLVLRDQPGGVDDVIAQLGRLSRRLRGKRHKARRKRLQSELTYFQNQRGRMAYADYQARGLPIGSGVVEAACKTLATQRLKRSGMSWRDGKQAILTIRSLQQSQRWPAAWALLAAHFRVTVLVVRKRGHPQGTDPRQEGGIDANRRGVSFRATPCCTDPNGHEHRPLCNRITEAHVKIDAVNQDGLDVFLGYIPTAPLLHRTNQFPIGSTHLARRHRAADQTLRHH
jgi:hypothetical protein